MAAGPPRLTPEAPAGAWAPGRAWAVGWPPRLARAPAGTKAQARLEPRGTELAPLTSYFKGLETLHLVLCEGVGPSGPGVGPVNCFGLGISSDLFPYLHKTRTHTHPHPNPPTQHNAWPNLLTILVFHQRIFNLGKRICRKRSRFQNQPFKTTLK